MSKTITTVIIILLGGLAWGTGDAVIAPSTGITAVPAVKQVKPGTDEISIPRMLSYQGRLTDSLGNPVPDGNYELTFRLYTQETGGTPFWTETQTVEVRGGVFFVRLGAVNPINNLPDEGTLYFGMQVGTGQELTPRLPIVSSAYAFKADTANYASPIGPAGGDLTGNYPSPSIAQNAITSDHIQDGTIVRADVAPDFKAPYADTADYALTTLTTHADTADYAAVAEEANTLRGYEPTDFVFADQKNSITSLMITDGEVQADDIAPDAVTSDHIQDGTIVRADVAPDFKAPYADTADYALAAGGGLLSFDHPLDPAHKILNHYMIAGPELRNIYEGSVILDASGRAVVKLPDYFSALNRNPHIQLTGVGTYEVYVVEDINNNRFVVGGKPNTKVYWQVTGERVDFTSEAIRQLMPVEQLKTGALNAPTLNNESMSARMTKLERGEELPARTVK